MGISSDTISLVAETYAGPLLLAGAFFFFAWFRTKKKQIFTDTHGSRWDVAGLALGCLVGFAMVHHWRNILPPPSPSINWLPYGIAVVLFYLAIAAVRRFPESADGVVICLVACATLVLVLSGFDYFFEPGESKGRRVVLIAAFAVSAFIVATAQGFLTWRLEAFDFFLVNLAQAVPVCFLIVDSLDSESGARTFSLPAAVALVGFACTLAQRRLMLTLAFGFFYGFFQATAFSYSYIGAPEVPSLGVALLVAASVVVPAVLAAFPAIAENRAVTRAVLPATAFALALAAALVARAGTGPDGSDPDTGYYGSREPSGPAPALAGGDLAPPAGQARVGGRAS